MDFLTELEIEAIWLSLKISAWAMIWSMPLALGTAWILARYEFPGKFLFDGIIHLPLVLPPVVIGYVLLITMGRQGVVGSFLYDTFGITLAFSWRGAAVAAGIMAFPLIVRAIRLSLEAVDQRLEAAARTLGAHPIVVFLTITLPLTIPGIIVGAILGFARCLGEFGATITFVSNIPGETRTLPIALYAFSQVPGGEAAALRIVVISVAIALFALAGSEILARRMRKRIGSGHD
ncbi:MAG: molybdate ABC transporter permease subunit [Rhodospirillaceae bacterium]|mgnify:CR=1 FL=1|nr:molybdate ABC transporter permease subunit [Rhodospirillaceae bacterium]|tara:strand:+ start:5694 stop:6395 length:702 start_codon:yes stop_codon:yes gene_type:complete